ncbi:winged helix-turn-helix domain-containing protein [Microbispora hainanensis]|uniref:winged helix-turn-helix domain-containing protein n=1 Tax=Microbispora hainanensis TaxID=568844 RepID=UPI0033C75A21
MVINYRADRPRWEQAAEIVEQRIMDGTYVPGTPLPGEQRLADELGLARTTVRKAIMALVNRGVLYKVPSIGTFVSEPKD